MRFTLSEIASVTGAAVLLWPGAHGGLLPVHDPEQAGPGTVYFPVYRSSLTDAVIEQVATQRAEGVALYAGQRSWPADRYPGLGLLVLPSPFAGYKALAAEARRRSGALVAGVTGSSGKSTTKEFLVSLFRQRGPVIATHESHNLLSDCAGLLLRLSEHPQEVAIVEMGFGWEGDIDRMAALAQPTHGIILKITAAHLDGTGGSWERLIHEKGRLGVHLPQDGVLAVHAEDAGCARLPYAEYQARVLRFGAGASAHVRYSRVRTAEAGTELTLTLFGQEIACRLQSYGAFQAANAAAAALIGHVAGLTPAEIRDGLQSTPPVPRRFQVHRHSHGLTVIDDAFNVTADGMLRGLENAARLAGDRVKVAAIGGVARLGDRAADCNRIVGLHVVRCGFHRVVLVHDAWSEQIRQGLTEAGMDPGRIVTVGSNGELPEALLRLARPDHLFYCKARYAGESVDAFRAGLGARGFEAILPDQR